MFFRIFPYNSAGLALIFKIQENSEKTLIWVETVCFLLQMWCNFYIYLSLCLSIIWNTWKQSDYKYNTTFYEFMWMNHFDLICPIFITRINCRILNLIKVILDVEQMQLLHIGLSSFHTHWIQLWNNRTSLLW